MTDVNIHDAEVAPCNMQPLDIVARLPRHPEKSYDVRDIRDIKRIIVHTTDWDCTPEELAAYDIGPNHISDTGCPAITYHGLIMPNGEWYKTLLYEEISWHAGPWNTGSLAIAMVYRCTNAKGEDVHIPREGQLKSLYRVCGSLCFRLGIPPTEVFGHREMKHTGWWFFNGSRRLRKTCPGMAVDLPHMRRRVTAYVQLCLRLSGHYEGAIDSIWGPMSRAAQARYLAERI